MLLNPRAIPQSGSILFMFSSYIIVSECWNTTNDSGQMRIGRFIKLAIRKRACQQMHLWLDVQEYFSLPGFPKGLIIIMLTDREYWAPNFFIYLICHEFALALSVVPINSRSPSLTHFHQKHWFLYFFFLIHRKLLIKKVIAIAKQFPTEKNTSRNIYFSVFFFFIQRVFISLLLSKFLKRKFWGKHASLRET